MNQLIKNVVLSVLPPPVDEDTIWVKYIPDLNRYQLYQAHGRMWKEMKLQGFTGDNGLPGVPGVDGFSPTVELTPIDNGYRIDITDVSGVHSFNIYNGEKGEQGESIVGPPGPEGQQGLQGIQGPPGPAGGIIYPNVWVDSNMYLHIEEPTGNFVDRLSYDNGYLTIS